MRTHYLNHSLMLGPEGRHSCPFVALKTATSSHGRRGIVTKSCTMTAAGYIVGSSSLQVQQSTASGVGTYLLSLQGTLMLQSAW
jgi:hypothetical protein